MNNVKLLPSLLIFAEVAQRGSFTDAAQHLGMSKSAVSQHISRLEEQIGVQLLSRNTRGMALTAYGTKLLSRSELLKDQVALAFQELDSAEQTPSGLFSVTFPHLLEKDVVTPALAQLCKEFPRIEIKVLITADDVIHSWWVPALGWKRDAIPGFVNEAWTNIDTPGTYRGQCAELCGKDHGFMPIVVIALAEDEFEAWVREQQNKKSQVNGPGAAQ